MCTYILLCKQKIHHNFSKKKYFKTYYFPKKLNKIPIGIFFSDWTFFFFFTKNDFFLDLNGLIDLKF